MSPPALERRRGSIVAALWMMGWLSGCGDGPLAWTPPTCETITGTSAVTFTRDEGATLTPSREAPLAGVAYTYGLAALDTPNTLLAAHEKILLRSTDAGCSWDSLGQVPTLLQLTPAPGNQAYGWVPNGAALYRIQGKHITALSPPTKNIVGLGVDAADGQHVRLGTPQGQLFESFDGGETWRAIGVPAASSALIGYTVAFDPSNLDHVLHGQASEGASVSTDGGASWTRSQGLSATGHANAFTIVVSPSDSRIVWLQGKDQQTSTGISRIYRSTDGGLTFRPIVAESADVQMANGMLLAPHPANSDVLYFEFGTSFAQYGTDLYRYDEATGQVTKTHNTHDSVSAIAFSPADPSVMYLGLTSVKP